MAKKSKRPSWFKLWLHHRPLFDAVPDDVAGRVVKAALNYFETGDVIQLGQLEMVVFASVKSDIDDALADYLRDVENGKKGGRPPRLSEEKPPVKEGNPPLPTVTEREGDGEGDGEEDGEEDGKAVKANKPRSCPPIDYESVKKLYNQCCPSLPRCTKLNDQRKKAIKARFNEGCTIADFEAAFTKAEASPFLTGKKTQGWRASFDWLIKSSNMTKVLEGNYDEGENKYGKTEHKPLWTVGTAV